MTPVDLPSGLASDSVATTDARTEANRHDDRRCSDSPMGQGHSVCPPPAGTVFEGSGTRGHGRSGRRPRVIHPVMWDPDYTPSTDLLPRQQVVMPDPALVDEVVRMISEAERPVVIGGRGAIWSGAKESLETLAEETGALLATTLLAK